MKVFLGSARQDPGALIVAGTSDWPFRQHVTPTESTASTIHIRNLHLAFPAGQVAGTRLVLTHSTYQLQRWLDWEAAHPGAAIAADANGPALRQCAGEAFTRRGPWSRVEIVEAGDEADGDDAGNDGAVAASPLRHAFVQPDPVVRRDVCARACDADPRNPALWLARGSVAMEMQDLQAALDCVQAAVELAPDWEAAHFELGKVWLRADDTSRAADAFARAAGLMPAFATAWTNLGAALGELERRDEALVALRRALEHDPHGHPSWNNLGVVFRDLGQLADAEAAFRRVVALAPAFVFGWYNLAQTLLLAEDYAGARRMYEEAFERDPQKSARQAVRLAVVRAATGDETGALDALASGVERLTGEALTQALEEAERALTGLLGNVGECGGTVRRVLRQVSVRSGRL